MKLKTSTAIAALLMLSGCFEMQQDIVVSDNGTTEINLVMSVDAALLNMGPKDKPDNFCTAIPAGKLPEGLKGSATRTTEKGDVVCTIALEGPTEQVFAVLAKGNLLGGDNQNKSKDLAMTITDQGLNKRLDLAIPPTPSKPGDNPQMESMLIGATSGRYLEWRVTAPQIIETSGKLSEDGKTASYSLPLASVLSNKTETLKFSVVFSDKPAGFTGWVKSLFQ
ncbi:hypothetical protein G6L90_06670 [Agrobacterium tumefaciens]|uniref:hypothetical protein n=1 Tax=Agrobacterium tumefaciens TaxID=358 RepID=UPI001571CF55|nr:hypothetical protein [Agrobacterium tumefaciens]WHO22639.1 hypothetical protein G6L90_06670 [Agrobacterium tumefaciens]